MAVTTDGIMKYLTIGGATYEVYDTTYTSLKNPNAIGLKLYNSTIERAAASQDTPTSTVTYDGSIANQTFEAAGRNAVTNISSNNDGKLILTRADGSKSDPITVKITATTSDTAASADKLNLTTDAGSSSVPVYMPASTGKPVAVSSIAYSLLPTGTTASTVAVGNHTHGNLTTDGKITTTATIASGDKLVIVDSDTTAGSKITGSSITFGTSETTFLSNKGTWVTPIGTTYTFDGTYNASTNKAATVSTVTNAVNALDGGTIGTGATNKTITSLSQTNGQVSATFSNISITASQISDFADAVGGATAQPASHTHGNISNDGKITSTVVSVANNDALLFADSSSGGKIERLATFDGSTTTQALTKKGTWETFLQSHQTYNSFTGSPTGNQTPSFGGTFTISQILQSTSGQVSENQRTVTIPSTIATNTAVGLVKPWYTHTAASTGPTTGNNSTAVTVNAITTTAGKYYAVEADSNGRLFVNVPWSDSDSHNTAYLYAGTSSGNANATTTNGNTYLILKDGDTVSSRVKLGSGKGISVTSDSSGNITIQHSHTDITAGTVGTSSSTSGATLAVPYITYDAQGHITAVGTHTHTISGFSTTDENVKQTATATTDVEATANYELLFSYTADNTTRTEGARKASTLRYNLNKKVLVNDGEVRANRGVFNELVATSLSASSATITDLTTQNATVVGLLDVQGQLHSNSWTNANIANIGGSFYITPTIEPTDSQATISITRNSITSWTVVLSGTFATNTIKTGTNSSGVAWPANSLVLITGNITVNNIEYPLGTLRGTLNSSVTATASGTSKTVTLTGVTDGQGNTTPAILQKLYELNGNANISNATFTSGKISLYQIGSYPVGIQMTAMGTNANSMIEIYGGVSTNPTVRIGHLTGLPNVNGSAPTGWGIYTDNGYFTGVIVSTAGKIGNWTIENTTSSSPTYGGALYTGSFGVDNGIFITPSYASSTQIGGSSGTKYWTLTASNKFGVTKTGELYANAAHIIGSIDATSFVARDSDGNARTVVNDDGLTINDTSESPVAQFAANGVTFNSSKAVTIGNQNASISFNPANGGSINITGTQVNFGAPVIQQITENIDIGGRNLLAIREYISSVAEAVEIDSEGWVSDTDDPTQDTRTWSYNGSNWQLSLEAGEYILSWETKVVTTNSNAGIRLYTNNNNTSVQIFAIDSTAFTTLGKQTYVFQLSEPTHTGNDEDYDSTNKVGLMFKLYDGGARFQLEKGNIATDWRPASDDLASMTSLETVASEIDGAKIDITALYSENDARQDDIERLEGVDKSQASSIGALQQNKIVTDEFMLNQTAINNQVVPVIQNIVKGIRIEPEVPSITVFTTKVEDNVEKQSYVKVTDTRVEIATSSSRTTAYADSESFNAQSGVFEKLFPQIYETGERNLVFQARSNGHFSLKQVK